MNRRLFLRGAGAAAMGMILTAAASRALDANGGTVASEEVRLETADTRSKDGVARSAVRSSTTSLHRSSSTQEAEIVPGLYRLAGVRGVNAYLWRPKRDTQTEAESILFDCGYPWSGREIIASLAALDYRPAEIRMIAITHADFDHVGRLAPLAAISHAEILAHAMEGPRLESAQWRRLPGQGKSLDPIILVARPLYRLWPPRPTKITRPAQDGAEIGGGWVAVHSPGHTPGHLAFFHPRLRTLIAGDALGSVRNGRVRLPKRIYAEDWDAALRSVQKLADLEPDVICFGHGRELRSATGLLHALAGSLPAEKPG